jgi:predicted transposase/invertase (TIGR01784 family)
MEIKERFIDPFTDFGFKKLFGSEPNKDLLIDFLNELLRGRKQIKSLHYSKNEHLGKTSEFRKAVFDLYCENENGEKFIIELQKVKQLYFKDRSIYYSTFPIQEQAPEGEYWDYRLKEVYTIGIMDFRFNDGHPDQFQHEVKLIETKTREVFYDKLTFIYLEMPKFVKSEVELVTHFDKWLFLLKNLNKFSQIPSILQERIFRKVFDIAEVSNLNEEEMRTYEASLKDKRDWKNAMDTAMAEAREEGMEKGRKAEKEEMAKQMKKENFAIDIISRLTGLSIEEINRL